MELIIEGKEYVSMGWAIALHGGAGDIPVNLPVERREPREAALRHILQIGVSALNNNSKYSPLDVVELVVYYSLPFRCIHLSISVCHKIKISVHFQTRKNSIGLWIELFLFSLKGQTNNSETCCRNYVYNMF